MSESLTNPTPQFGTAEYSAKPGADQCRTCNQQLGASYYRVNGVAACANCAEQLENQRPKDSRQLFIRALLFGAGGAIIGLTIYAAFEIATGWIIGYISLAVGYIVAKALMMGSRGIGGRRYQIAAVILAYIAVSMAAVPVMISQAIKLKAARGSARIEQTSLSPSKAGDDVVQQQPALDAGNDSAGMGPMKALGLLIGIGLASPFLELSNAFSGLIGLFILFIGMKIAWKMTAGTPIEILGPYRSSTPALDPAGAE